MKIDRKRKFDQLIAKRFENIREKIKQREMKRKSTLRKSKRVQQAMNHGKLHAFTRPDEYLKIVEHQRRRATKK